MLDSASDAVGRHSRGAKARGVLARWAGMAGATLLLGLLILVVGGQTPAAQAAGPAQEPGTGDSVTGKNLFTGGTRLENGGPPCLACHGISGIGVGVGDLGGGALGPNLTDSKLGDAMVLWPETIPPMQAIFTEKPLTDGEKADLLAFFRSASVAERPTEAVYQLAGLAVIGLGLILGAAHLMWIRRSRSVRRTMVGRRTLSTS